MSKFSLDIVICSVNRKSELQRLLSRILTEYPHSTQVVVVDSSDEEKRLTAGDIQEIKQINTGIKLSVMFTDLRSLPAQKKIGVANLVNTSKAAHLLFLDDDTYLSPNTAKEMQSILISSSSLIAISGITRIGKGENNPIHALLKKFFMLGSNQEGALLPSGINVPVTRLSNSLVYTEWLIGCSMWKADYLVQAPFPDNLPGSALCEDVIISQHARSKGEIAVAPWLRLEHYESEVNRPDAYLHGRRNQRNRYELTKIPNSGVTRIPFWWSSVGIMFEQTLFCFSAFLKRRPEKFANHSMFLKGTFRGSWDVLINKDPV